MADWKPGDDKDAIDLVDVFKECAERLRIGETAESENRTQGLLALNFCDLGKQWDDDIENQRKIDNRPALTTNHTATIVRRIENTLRQQRPRIKCHPVSGGARVEDAEVVNGLIRHIETLSNASVAYDVGGAFAVKTGWGYWRIVSEYTDPKSFDQDLKIVPIHNPFTVYMDPASRMPAGEDQQWCIITEKMKRREAKRRGIELSEFQDGAPGDMMTDWENSEEIRLAEYFRLHEIADTLVLMNDGRTALKSELPDDDAMLGAGWVPAVGPDGKAITRPTTRCVVQWFRLNGKKVVERKTLPGYHIPVIRCQGNALEVNGTISRWGIVRDLMDPARMVNYWNTANTERVALTPKAPWTAYESVIEGHDEWHSANTRPYSVLVGKAVTGPNGELLPLPTRTQPAGVEAGVTESLNRAFADFMAIAGMPPENPETMARVVSGNKMLARKLGMQDLTHYQFYDNQTLAIMWTGIILLELIPYYYDMPRMQRIIGEDGIPKMVGINQPQPAEGEAGEDMGGIYNVKHNLQMGKFDVVMDTGPGYATKREEGAENMLALLGTPLAEVIVPTGADVILRNLDFAGAEELADRVAVQTPEGMEKALEGLPKQAQTIVKSLMSQNEQLKQTVQQQALEIKYKANIEGAKLDQKDKQSQREDATRRKDIDSHAQTARDVAEIYSAAQLLDSRMEQEANERETQMMIDKGLDS